MQVVLEVKNPTELQLLLQYVKLLSSAKVVEAKPKPATVVANSAFFDRHFGALRSRMTAQEMEIQLKKLREEWERDTW